MVYYEWAKEEIQVRSPTWQLLYTVTGNGTSEKFVRRCLTVTGNHYWFRLQGWDLSLHGHHDGSEPDLAAYPSAIAKSLIGEN